MVRSVLKIRNPIQFKNETQIPLLYQFKNKTSNQLQAKTQNDWGGTYWIDLLFLM